MAEIIINCSKHRATEWEKSAGVLELRSKYRKAIVSFLKFKNCPSKVTKETLDNIAKNICSLLDQYAAAEKIEFKHILIGGPNCLMSHLEKQLRKHNYIPVYGHKDFQTQTEYFIFAE